jgi:ligand-binding sensor domain-containing protein
MLRRILFILVLLLIAEFLSAQEIDENNFRHFNVRDGLSDNKVTGMAQDPYGYIWISTSHGLNRFDGISFSQFFQSSQHNPIPDNNVFSLQLVAGNELAIATDDGAQIISTRTLETKNLEIPSSEALRYWANSCKYIQKDDLGNYGVSTKTGFYIFSANGKLKKRFDYFSDKDIGHAWMMFGNHIMRSPEGFLFQENSEGAFIYDPYKEQIANAIKKWPVLAQIISPNYRPRFFFISGYKLVVLDYKENNIDIVDMQNGNIKAFPSAFNLRQEINWQSKLTHVENTGWVINCASKGFFKISIDTISWTITSDPRKYFADKFCSIVYCDNKKRLWIGTDDGFYMENKHPRLISSFVISGIKDTDNYSVTSLLITADKIYAGTDINKLIVIDKQTHKTIKEIAFKRKQTWSDMVNHMVQVAPDTIWIAYTSGLLWLNTNNFSIGDVFLEKLYPYTKSFFYLFNDKEHGTWIVSNVINSVLYFNQKTKKIDSITSRTDQLFRVNGINGITEDKYGNIWFGGDAIARWNPRLKKIDSLIEHLPTQKNRNRGYTVMSDSKGNIWTTLNGDGIANINGNPLVHVRPENFLTDHSTNLVPSLHNDNIFLATNSSIGFLNIHDLKSIVFNNEDGMPLHRISCNYLSYDSSDKSVWFASRNSICKILPGKTNDSILFPILKIASVSVLNDTFINYPPASISLKHFQNDIKINLSTINFSDPMDMRFAYRLKNGNDSNWIETGTQPMLLLTNLPTGDYKLEIKLYSYNNKWPAQIAPFEIAIQPPFWKTWWFRALIVIFAISSLYVLYRNRIREVREKANLDKQLAEFEMKALHAQMNPHFIFNCLNSIREMILNSENQQASHYLSKFAQLIRMTLNQSSKPFISLQQTIDYLQRYLEMEQIRNHQFDYQIQVDDQLKADEIMIPPMLIQPFLENAIWHGASPGKELQLKLHFLKMDQKLVCIVDDNGVGILASEKTKKDVTHNSIGISNVKERIQVLNEKYNLQSSVTIDDKSFLVPKNGTGTIVKLFFPLNSIQL